MTDRLTPADWLRDLADILARCPTRIPDIVCELRDEAARREAEAPTRTDAMRQIAQEYGFGSRTPTLDALDLTKKPDAPPPTAPDDLVRGLRDRACHAHAEGNATATSDAWHFEQAADAIEALRAERDALREKYAWLANNRNELDSEYCKEMARAEAAEAELRIHRERAASLNNMWRHEFSREVEAAADKLFARMAWPHKEIHALAGGNDD